MNARHTRVDVQHILPRILQAMVFMTGALIYGAVTVPAGSTLLWSINVALLGCAVVLPTGALR